MYMSWNSKVWSSNINDIINFLMFFFASVIVIWIDWIIVRSSGKYGSQIH